jgi:ribosomal 50S subunit-associated protein YjgA (DUF615 family)
MVGGIMSDSDEAKKRKISRKRGRLEYLASLLRQRDSKALDQIADLLCTLSDTEIVVLVDKLRLWLI